MKKKYRRTRLTPEFIAFLEMFKEKLPSKIRVVGECWAWKSLNSTKWPPMVKHNGKSYRAARLVAAAFIDATILTKGLHKANACHKCDNSWCVRPEHLFIGTQSENMQDMLQKGRQRGATKHYK